MAEFIPVDSSVMSHVMHDGSAMHIRYNSGKTYVHAGVSRAKFESFLAADSKGQFFNTHIAKQHPGKARG